MKGGSKKAIMVVAAAILLLSFGYFVSPQPNSPQSGRSIFKSGPTTYVLNCSLLEVPQSVPVLDVEGVDISENEAIAIARATPFNMAGELNARDLSFDQENMMAVQIRREEDHELINELILFREGPIEYNGLWSDYTSPPNLPTKERARRIAEEFLKKVEDSGCFFPKPPLELVFKGVHVGEFFARENTSWVVYWNVAYELRYENMPIAGHSAVSVSVGHGDSVVGFRAEWRNLRPGSKVKITVTPEEAFRRLPGQPFKTTEKIKIIIKRIVLGYWPQPISDRQNRVLPVYLFEGTAMEHGEEQEFTWPVPATNLEYPPLH